MDISVQVPIQVMNKHIKGFSLLEMIILLTLLGLIPFFVMKIVSARPVLTLSQAELNHIFIEAKQYAVSAASDVKVTLSLINSQTQLSSMTVANSATISSFSLAKEVSLNTSPSFDEIVFRPTQSIQLYYQNSALSANQHANIQIQDKHNNVKTLKIYAESGAIND